MYAIVSIAGQQFKVEEGKKVYVHRLKGEVGDDVTFDKVLLISKENKVNVGAPYIPDAVISAQIVSHVRGDKVLVFKKKRRKTYQKLNGHRQDFTEVLIEEISETGAPKKTERKKAPKVAAPEETSVQAAETEAAGEEKAPKKVSKKAASSVIAEEKPKKAPVKKAVEKKPAAKTASKK